MDSSMPEVQRAPNHWVNLTTEKLRFSVPSALRRQVTQVVRYRRTVCPAKAGLFSGS